MKRLSQLSQLNVNVIFIGAVYKQIGKQIQIQYFCRSWPKLLQKHL